MCKEVRKQVNKYMCKQVSKEVVIKCVSKEGSK